MADVENPKKRLRTDEDGNSCSTNSSSSSTAAASSTESCEHPAHGSYCHVDYASTDMEATSTFFTEMFGWSAMKREDRHYYPLSKVCAHSRLRKETDIDSSVIYINVDNLDEALKKAQANGATIVTEPTPVDTYGKFVVLKIPGDVCVAFWQTIMDHTAASSSSASSNGSATKESTSTTAAPNSNGLHIRRVSYMSLMVSDTDQAIAFYCGKLGFTVTKDVKAPEYRWATIRAPNQEHFEFTLMNPTSDEEKSLVGRQSGSIPLIVLETDDVRADFARLKADGVEFTQEPKEQFYGIESLMRDPFGNIINLIQTIPH